MKTIKTQIVTCFSLLVIALASTNASAQSTKSKVISFMGGNGWQLDTLIKPLQPKENEFGAKGLYEFKKENKYTIVAYSENKDVERVSLKVKHINGDNYKRHYNTHIIKSLFRLPFECAVMMLSENKDVTLAVESLNKKASPVAKTPDTEYLIFYR